MDMLEVWRAGAGFDEKDSGSATEEATTTTWTCDGAPFRIDLVPDQGHVCFGAPTARDPLWASEAMWDIFDHLG